MKVLTNVRTVTKGKQSVTESQNRTSLSPAPVHTCNPSYSGGRDQKENGLKPAWGNSSQDTISKILNIKVVEWLKCEP
jgi:hypothetical protein